MIDTNYLKIYKGKIPITIFAKDLDFYLGKGFTEKPKEEKPKEEKPKEEKDFIPINKRKKSNGKVKK